MSSITLHLGLDVHKDSITTAVADGRSKDEIRLFGSITNDLHALAKALSCIRKAHPDAQLDVAYEAGPCAFGIARPLKQLKVPCLVAAPSLIPKQPGSPFKTDKPDARTIARLLRAGELTASTSPSPLMRPFAICAALGPLPSTICAVVAFASRTSCCATATAIKARPIGVSPTCVISVN
ncbi:MAG TPA: transposase [Candidatus Limnocylindrales bacterium]|nr:transposase [Candidatus Limnocylindrales bacterium]